MLYSSRHQDFPRNPAASVNHLNDIYPDIDTATEAWDRELIYSLNHMDCGMPIKRSGCEYCGSARHSMASRDELKPRRCSLLYPTPKDQPGFAR